VTQTKNPRWVKEEENDATEESTSERIRVFTLVKRALFISTYNGLFQGQRSKIYLQALICYLEQTITDRSTYPGKGCLKKEKKKKERKTTQQATIAGNKKYLSKKHKFTSSSTRGLAILEEEKYIAKSERS
jgi:hypothetical protein